MSSIFYCTLKNNNHYNGQFISTYAYQLKRGYGVNIIHPTDLESLKNSLEIISCKNHPLQPLQPFKLTNALPSPSQTYKSPNGITCIIDSNTFIHPQSIIDLILTYGIPNFTKYINYHYTILIKTPTNVHIFRDPSGSKPLYVGFNKNYDIVTITSEIKAIPKIKDTKVYTFPAGYYWSKNTHSFIKIPQKEPNLSLTPTLKGMQVSILPTSKKIQQNLKNVCLLNGDIPSLLLYNTYKEHQNTPNVFYTLNYTSNEVSPNPNVEYSKIMASKLKFNLNIISFNLQDIIDNIEKVIICLETYDHNAIQFALPLYIFSTKINNNETHTILNTTYDYNTKNLSDTKNLLIIDKICGYFNISPNFNFYNNQSNTEKLENIKNTKIDNKKIENLLYQVVGRTPQDYSEDWIKELTVNVGKSLPEYYKDIYNTHFEQN